MLWRHAPFNAPVSSPACLFFLHKESAHEMRKMRLHQF